MCLGYFAITFLAFHLCILCILNRLKMGGKSYFCDYCQCYMKNDKNLRKTHNDGLQHKIIKTSLMKKFEDPRELYEQEINKQPCFRYFKGFCKYDLYCQFTHFNEFQLKQLGEIVDNIANESKSKRSKNECLKFPWINSITKRNLKLLPTNLPLSLRPLNLNKISKLDVTFNKWG